MEENRLTEEEVQGIAGGGKAIDYIAEQGKKVVGCGRTWKSVESPSPLGS